MLSLSSPFATMPVWGPTAWAPAVDAYTRANKELVLRLDVPGVDPADIALTVQGRTLTIAGERAEPEQPDEEMAWYRTVRYGRFERSVTLPEGFDPGGVKAWYRHGVLEITVPLPAALREQPIAIEAEAT